MMLASHHKASELSKALFNLKELFLVCFFLNIGLSAHPTTTGIMLALLLLLLLPIKGVLYFGSSTSSISVSARHYWPRYPYSTLVSLA